MLKAYDFSKYKDGTSMLRINSFNKKENEIAQTLVDSILAEEPFYEKKACRVCGSENTTEIFTKWGVSYYRCIDCDSIFVNVTEKGLKKYKENKKLIDLRISLPYQEEESENRSYNWEELLDWIKFRTFRYVGKKEKLSIIDYGNRYSDLVKKIKNSDLCMEYELRESILRNIECDRLDKADIVLYFNVIQQSLNPEKDLQEAYDSLKEDGLLFLSTRVGTGFDILTLKSAAKIFPYEHILLPSVDGLRRLLENAGFSMLEYSTPGRMDVEYVHDYKNKIAPENLFVKYMMEHGDEMIYSEFQRFLQKSGLSSHARIIAQKGKKK